MSELESHILKSFDEELDRLRSLTMSMAYQASRSIGNAVRGLVQGQSELCSEVIADDEVIDQQEKKIDELGLAMLLKHKPVASDLRMITSTMNISRSIERVADHAVTVAKRARKILKANPDGLDERRLIEPFAQDAREAFDDAMLAYADNDGVRALRVKNWDVKIDKSYKRVSKTLTALASDATDRTESLLHLLFIARSVERIGDLAVNIAEDVFFITSADDIRHS
ncbi:MAG: phosphate signaling complex protein PhoU [Verrucomicrobiales bacterium]